VRDLVVAEREKVSWWWCHRRCTGSFVKYERVSFIHPMFHLNPKPRPPRWVGRDTAGHEVDSSATIITPGWRRYRTAFVSWRKEMASRFSLPPY
jgi:hypothetical protein